MRLRFLLLCFSIFLFAFSFNGQNFEGVVKINSATNNVTLTISKNIVLMETSSNSTLKMLTNLKTGIFYTLYEKNGEKVAIKNNMNDPRIKQSIEQHQRTTNKNNEIKVKVTSETKIINGYKCTKIHGSSVDGEGFAWINKTLQLDLEELLPMTKKGVKLEERLNKAFSKQGFVMELYSKDKKTGKEATTSIEVKEKKIVFDLPSLLKYYDIMDMTDMDKMRQELISNPQKAEKLQRIIQKTN